MQAKKDWFDHHPGFWKRYRKNNPDKTLRNSLLQRKRNQQHQLKKLEKRATDKTIAKMDVLEANNYAASREYWMIPVIAKMDVLRGYLTVVQRERSHFF